MKAYKYLLMHDGNWYYASHPETLDWIEAEIRKEVPGCRRADESSSNGNALTTKGAHFDKLQGRDDEIRRQIIIKLLDNGWEPFQIGQIGNASSVHLRLKSIS